MSDQPLSIATLFDALHEKLGLELLAGGEGAGRPIEPHADSETTGKANLVGHLNFIHPNAIQVLSDREILYLEQLDEHAYHEALDSLFGPPTLAVMVGGGIPVPATLTRRAHQAQTPLLFSALSTHQLISHIQYFLDQQLTERLTLHGVFLEVMGNGLLLMGESGMGKSELALELINRGHRLICDDVIEFSRPTPETVVGNCPALLEDFLEVRGLGLLNVRAMFGDNAIRPSQSLALIIRLVVLDAHSAQFDRLRGSRTERQILGVNIAEYTLPVAPGRNLAILVEAAVRNHKLLSQGYDASADFSQRQTSAIARNPS